MTLRTSLWAVLVGMGAMVQASQAAPCTFCTRATGACCQCSGLVEGDVEEADPQGDVEPADELMGLNCPCACGEVLQPHGSTCSAMTYCCTPEGCVYVSTVCCDDMGGTIGCGMCVSVSEESPTDSQNSPEAGPAAEIIGVVMSVVGVIAAAIP